MNGKISKIFLTKQSWVIIINRHGMRALVMVIDLKKFFSTVGEYRELEYELAIEELELGGVKPLREPVQVKAVLKSEEAGVLLSLELRYSLVVPCDRCLETAELPQDLKLRHTLVRELNPEDDMESYIPVDGDKLELDELVYADIVLNLPAKLLCREDCKGICPICGADQNTTICSCESRVTDPRLEVLKQLLLDDKD